MAVFAATGIFAPSFEALKVIASPIPLEAPVLKIVFTF